MAAVRLHATTRAYTVLSGTEAVPAADAVNEAAAASGSSAPCPSVVGTAPAIGKDWSLAEADADVEADAEADADAWTITNDAGAAAVDDSDDSDWSDRPDCAI